MEDGPLFKKFGNHCTDNKPQAQKQTQGQAPVLKPSAPLVSPARGGTVYPFLAASALPGTDSRTRRGWVPAAAFAVPRSAAWRESTSLRVLVCGVGPRGRCTLTVGSGWLSSPGRSAPSRCESWKEPHASDQKPPAKSSFDLTTRSLETPT